MSQNSTNVQRRSQRLPVNANIAVIDTLRDKIVGHIGNISGEGLMLVSPCEIREDSLHQYHFVLRDRHGSPQRMDLGVHQQWTEAANMPGHFWVGFSIIDISADNQRKLDQWIKP